MIYLFNDVKELTGTVRNNHILNLLYEREKNGIYSVSAEIPVTYNDQGTIYNYNKKIQKSDFLGHYDKEGRFQLHKIAAVDIENGSIFVKGIHIFFDEAKAGSIIKDRRFVNREIIDGARVAFESIGWSVTDFDVSVGKTYNFYNVTPLEARQILVETFGFEFDYWLDFDGKKVTNRHVAVKEKIGEKTNKRYTYGHNVLNIRAEQDYSEIYTAVIGRGKGEEIEETGGYGRRIEYTDVVWTTPSKPLNKPAGTRILEDPNATQLFGYKENGVVKPRIKVEVFSDIESPTELIQASYEWLMDNNVPKAVFSLKVADGDGLNLGDEVFVIYRDIDLVKSARVEKVIDDLVSGNRDVEFGDTAYFDTDRRLSGLRKDLKRYSGETGDRIYRLKMEFNRRFDEEVSSWVEEFEQNLIDQQAQIEADRENMTNLIEGTRADFTDNLNAEITQTKEYAEQQAHEKAETVRTDLETITNGHQQMLVDLENNVINIDDFLGDSRSLTLDERLYNITTQFENRIRNIDSTHYNMLRGSSFDNPDLYTLQNTVQIIDNETDNFARLGLGSSNIPFISLNERFQIVKDKTYHLVFNYRTENVPEADYLELRGSDLSQRLYLHNTLPLETFSLKMDGLWNKKVITFTAPVTQSVQLYMGTSFNMNNTQRGILDIKKPYLTTTNNREWLPHPDDDVQNVSEVIRRVTLLEDGQNELITRTEFDFETESIIQDVKRVESTVEGSKTVLQRLEDWEATNGAAISETVYGFEQKVWLNDVSEINPNVLSFGDFSHSDIRKYWTAHGNNATAITDDGLYRVRNTNSGTFVAAETPRFKVEAGKNYTLSFKGDKSNIDGTTFNRVYNINDNGQSSSVVGAYLQSNGRHTYKFTASRTGEMRVIIGTNTPTGQDVSIYIGFVKVEEGWDETPFLNSISLLEHSASEIRLAVQELDGNVIKESDLQITADYWQLGSTRIGAEDVSSVLRGSPDALDAVVSNFNLTGNLNANGQITSLAVDAIEGNFARLFANQLTANIITSDHIQVGTALIDKFFATAARIDQLITKTHFVNEMHALTLNVVDLNASHIRTRLLSANTIEASWIKSGTALLDRVFSSTAMFERMMAKSAFVTTLSTITLDLHELTIWRPDGVAFVMNGMERFGHPVPVVRYLDDEVETDDKTYWTNSRGAQVVGIAYGDHAGRYYNLVVGAGLRWDSDYAVQYCNVQIRTVNAPSGVNIPVFNKEITARRADGLQWHTLSVPLGRPTYGAITFQIEIFRRGENVYAPVEMRYGRSWISA